MIKRKCDYCGKTYLAREYPLKKYGSGFCSKSCATLSRSFGEDNPNWRGGISKNHYHYKLIHKKRYPEHVRARELARQAIKTGTLTKQRCEVCGSENTVAHHDDYSKPLEVRWFCRKHHREIHDGMRFNCKKLVLET